MAASIRKSLLGFSNTFSRCKVTFKVLTCNKLHSINVAAETEAVKSQPYHLYSGLIIERRPVITAELNDIEKRYSQLLSSLELERSHLSSHELRHKNDLELAARKLKGEVDENERETALLTAADMEDLWNEEKSKFNLASRSTEADESGSRSTHRRKLDRSLYLLVRQRFPPSHNFHWVFPQGLWREGESLRQTSERVANELSPGLTLQFIGNAPVSHYRIQYPSKTVSTTTSHQGAKVFLHKAMLQSGDMIRLEEQSTVLYDEFMWVTSTEVKEMVTSRYWKSVQPVLHEY